MFCKRCGTCCQKGGPALHIEDKHIIKTYVSIDNLITFRKGEIAYNPETGQLIELPSDLIKIRGNKKDDYTCIFFDKTTSSCLIYEHRPLECKLLKCWAPEEVINIFLKNLLTRKDIFDGKLLKLFIDYDNLFSLGHIKQLLIEKEYSSLNTVIKQDIMFRKKAIQLIKSYNLPITTLNPLLGRPVKVIIKGLTKIFA